jgi:IS30 family transposase
MPGTRLGVEERQAIEVALGREELFVTIALRLSRPTSTVSREVNANGGRSEYRAMPAQRASAARGLRHKLRKLMANVVLAAEVAEGLAKRWSPAEVAARLIVDHPDEPEMRVSHETIYTSLYLQGKGGLKKELIAALRSGRLRRRPRRRGEKAKRGNVLGLMTPISARPPEAADRSFPGHWEGDLIMGAFNRSALVTVVERRSRFLLLGDLPEGHDAQCVYECLIELTADLPDALRRSLTWDQGREMANWARLQADADIDVFFCDPHSPWQRPSNEHMNGLLRQYFPKGTDLNRVSIDQVRFVAPDVDHHVQPLRFTIEFLAVDRTTMVQPTKGQPGPEGAKRFVTDQGGDPACWAGLLCEDCGVVLDGGTHRAGYHNAPAS